MPDIINLRINIRMKSMLSITHCKKKCITKSTVGVLYNTIYFTSELQSEGKESVTKPESVKLLLHYHFYLISGHFYSISLIYVLIYLILEHL